MSDECVEDLDRIQRSQPPTPQRALRQLHVQHYIWFELDGGFYVFKWLTKLEGNLRATIEKSRKGGDEAAELVAQNVFEMVIAQGCCSSSVLFIPAQLVACYQESPKLVTLP